MWPIRLHAHGLGPRGSAASYSSCLTIISPLLISVCHKTVSFFLPLFSSLLIPLCIPSVFSSLGVDLFPVAIPSPVRSICFFFNPRISHHLLQNRPHSPTMYTPTSTEANAPLNPDALRLLSLYTMLASLAAPISPKPSVPTSSSSQGSDPATPTMTIKIDASTTILGHSNTIQLPSTDRIKHLLEIAFKNIPDKSSIQDDEYDEDGYAVLRPMNVEVKVQAGVNICGSRNVVISGGGGGGVRRSAMVGGQGVKRMAEGVSAS